MQLVLFEIEVYCGMAHLFYILFESMLILIFYEMSLDTMYINHIKAFGNKHDAAFSVSLIEAILNCIKRMFTEISRVLL